MYELNQIIEVTPTRGLDVVRGVVKVLALATYEAVEASGHPADAYLTGDAEFDWEVQTGTWIGYRYEDDEIHEHYGFMYLPKILFDEIAGK